MERGIALLNSSVRRRVALALFVWSGVTATAFAISTFLAADEMELIVLEQNLSATATRIKQALLAGEMPSYPNETWFRGGLESDLELPRVFHELPTGSFNDLVMDGEVFHVWIDEVPGDRLFLIYDLAVIEHYERQLVLFLLTAVVLLSSLGLAFGMAGTRWVMRPVEQLSNTVRRMKAGTESLDVPQERDADLAPMVTAINDLLQRNLALVKREGHFTRIVSHELRNPLATLDAAIALTDSRATDEAIRVPLGRAQRASRRLSDVVSALLQFSRSEALSERGENQCDAAEVIHDAVAGLADAGFDSDAVSCEVSRRQPVDMEPALFGVIVSNLLGNAWRHGSGHVRIRCDDAGLAVANPLQGEACDAMEFAPDRLGIGIVELLCGYRNWRFVYDVADGVFTARVLFQGS